MAASSVARRLRAILPWFVALGALWWLFYIVPVEGLRAALARAPLGWFVALVAVAVVGTLFLDSLATWATFRWALPDAGVTYRETVENRGASYLLSVIHYGVGQGSFAYFVHRRHNVELPRAAGATMLILGVNVILVALCAFVVVVVGGAPETPALRWIVIGLACAFPAYFAVIWARPRFLERWGVLKPLFAAGVRGHLIATGARLPHIVWMLAANYLAMRLFGIDPPIGRAVALLPLVFVVSVLPISPSGLGTAQAASVALFTPYAHGGTLEDRRAAVLACALALQFLALVVQALIGLVFLRRVTRERTVEPGR